MATTIIIVPCYNEAARLDVRAFRACAAGDPDLRFLFVDDGSTDGTAAQLARLAADAPGAVEVIALPRNRGKGEAVRQGFLRAFERGAAYVGFWDADLSTPLDDIATFRRLLEERPDLQIVFGARVNLLGRSVRRNLVRHWAGRVFATFAVAVIGVPIYDTQCGAKLFRATDLVRSIFRAPFLSRWLFDVELVARLSQQARAAGGAQPGPREIIYEYPLTIWHDVAGSKVRYGDVAAAAVDLVRIYARYGGR